MLIITATLLRNAAQKWRSSLLNHAEAILNYTDYVLNCDIHTRVRTKSILKENGAKVVCGLDDIMNAPVNGSGYNEKYGLLGSNKSTEDQVKLFPRDAKTWLTNPERSSTRPESM